MSTNEVILDGLKNRIRSFFEDHYDKTVREISENSLKNSIEIDYNKLDDFDSTVAEDFADNPEQWITNAKAALEDYSDDTDIENPRILVKNYNVYNPAIRNLRDKHLGKLVRLDGTVSKATGILHKANVAAFECRKCGSITKIKQPLDSDLEYPTVCSGEDCNNRVERDFRINPTLSETINFRKVEIQEPPEETSGGETPETQTFTVKGDIADNVTAGDNITGIGIYRASDQGNTSIFRTYVKGVNIIPEEKEFEELEITDEDKEKIEELSEEDDIYEKLRDSVAPNLYDLKSEKEAILYQLFRGVRKTEMDGTNVRGDIHVLMVGDPGTGKSSRYNTSIIKSGGDRVSIGKFVNNLMTDPEPDEDGDLIEEIEDDVEVLAMDKDGEIEPRQVEAVWKKQTPNNIYSVTLQDGREIEATSTHPLFTTDGDGHIVHKEIGELQEGDFIAVPREIDYEGIYELEALERHKKNTVATELSPPSEWTKKLARFIGLIVSEGNISDNSVSLNSDDKMLLDVFEDGINHLGLECEKRAVNERKGIYRYTKTSSNLVNLLEEIDGSISNNSRGQKVPEPFFSAPKDIRKGFLRGYIDSKVHIDDNGRRAFEVGSMSEDLVRGVQRLLDTIGIASQVEINVNSSAEKSVSYGLRVVEKSFDKYVEEVGFLSKKNLKRAKQIMRDCDATKTNADVIPDLNGVIEETRKLLGMSQHDFSVNQAFLDKFENGERNPSRETLKTLVNDMVKELQLSRSFGQLGVAEEINLNQSGYIHKIIENTVGGGQVAVQSYESVQEQANADLHKAHENLIRLESLAWGDVRWVPLESVEKVECDDEWLYDLQVEDTHNYIANGIMSHNSQLLRYASKLAPRGVMTSGQGASEAGLCVGPDTNVKVNGKDMMISDLVQNHIGSSVNVPTSVEVNDIETYSMDVRDGVVSSNVSHLWRMPEQQATVIELKDGRDITVSNNTPFVTGYDYNGSFVWTDAEDIDVGMDIGVFNEELSDVEDGMEISWSTVTGKSHKTTELYDLTTASGNFYANGVVVHNTAAAVRDSEFGGEDKWTLKAGALVLADQGLACVDEIDKMDSSDRSAMHEGLEQQTISVSKAGINSTLKSRCTLLAAANPKDGRWNEFDPVPAQINLEPALVSRFDMIFAPEDARTEERDTKLADHILNTNLRGQQLEAGEEPDEITSDVEPEISPGLFKKYVAYSRQNYDPVMTDEAKEFIREFFVNIRSEGEEEGAIPVTARKIEGIVRISEACARIQLSDKVEKKHAERAKNIVMESLKDVGYDEDAGRFDIDMTETNQSTTQRQRRNALIQVIENNEDEGEQGAPRDLIIEIMTEEYDFDEDEIDFDLRKLGREGKEIYEPRNGEYSTM